MSPHQNIAQSLYLIQSDEGAITREAVEKKPYLKGYNIKT